MQLEKPINPLNNVVIYNIGTLILNFFEILVIIFFIIIFQPKNTNNKHIITLRQHINYLHFFNKTPSIKSFYCG